MEKTKKRLTMQELLESGLVKWTNRKTIERKVQYEGFPCYKTPRYEFDPREVEIWFKKRETKAS